MDRRDGARGRKIGRGWDEEEEVEKIWVDPRKSNPELTTDGL